MKIEFNEEMYNSLEQILEENEIEFEAADKEIIKVVDYNGQLIETTNPFDLI